MADSRHFEKNINCHISATIAMHEICHDDTHCLYSIWVVNVSRFLKSKMADGRHLEYRKIAIAIATNLGMVTYGDPLNSTRQ